MTATAYVRLYQESHTRSTGYQVTEWVDNSYTSAQLLAPFLMSRSRGERADAFERVATPLDLSTYNTTSLQYFELHDGDTDPYPSIAASLVLPETTYLVISILLRPHWDVSTAINGVSYAAVSDQQSFPLIGISSVVGGTGVRVVDTASLYLTGAQFTDDSIGSWIYLSGMTTSANDGAMRVVSFEGELVRVFRPAGPLVTETCTAATWNKKYLLINSNHAFLRREPRMAWAVSRSSGLSYVPVTSGSVGIITTVDSSGDFYLTDRITLLFPTVNQAIAHMTSVRTYLKFLEEQLNEIDSDVSFGTLGPFDYPGV